MDGYSFVPRTSDIETQKATRWAGNSERRRKAETLMRRDERRLPLPEAERRDEPMTMSRTI
uniref:Uncharacterized protein n=1 Tax=Oryza sativa subsp. japonica TaxID=39947 RepID=Q67V52_ORYSJ|nr:hypothetical protein [Oryza sativa Japonica Group]